MTRPAPPDAPLLRITGEDEARQRKRLAEVRADRNDATVQAAQVKARLEALRALLPAYAKDIGTNLSILAARLEPEGGPLGAVAGLVACQLQPDRIAGIVAIAGPMRFEVDGPVARYLRRGALVDGQPALVTNDPAAVVLKDADTIVFFGNTYKRHNP